MRHFPESHRATGVTLGAGAGSAPAGAVAPVLAKGSIMSRISKKKKAVVFVATAVALIGGGFAFAYWTTGGSGTGTAATDASVSDVTVN